MRVTFKTVGCRLNQAETAQLAARVRAAGHIVVPFGAPCDAGVIHTCAITANAVRTCAQYARALKRSCVPSPVVILAGCAVEVDAAGALSRSAGADLVLGQHEKYELAERLADCVRERAGQVPPVDAAPSGAPPSPHAPPPYFDTTRAFIKVQDGCDFRCAYCIVPQTRHAPRSRPMTEILAELERLTEHGYREVVLTGANLGCYNDLGSGLVALLERVERVPGIARIRISSIELSTAERGVIDFMRESRKLCRFLHVPMQSGDDGILATMGRRYTRDRYRDTILYAAERLPGVGLGTDIIVGFPGESDAAFEQTVALVEALPFSNLHVFPYSPRPGTRAADMPGQLTRAVKRERVARLTDIGNRKRAAFAHTYIGLPVTMLVERIDEHGMASGWTGEYLEAAVNDATLAVNDLVTFRPADYRDGRLV